MVQKLRVPLGFAVALTVLYISNPGALSIAAGLPIAFCGVVFRAAAAGVIRKNRELATGGPYRFTRNPLYLGSFLLALGFAVMGATVAGALMLVVPFAVVYRNVMKREEKELETLFSDRFSRYRESVPMFFPRKIGAGIVDSFSVDCYMANKEYNASLGFLGAVLILVAKAYWRA
jgi:protein-S-isoprenylcysteine O-methyltransferase Ste14